MSRDDIRRILSEHENVEIHTAMTHPKVPIGDVLIITKNPLDGWEMEKLYSIRPAGIQLCFSLFEPKSCICFGPPSRSCSVHGA